MQVSEDKLGNGCHVSFQVSETDYSVIFLQGKEKRKERKGIIGQNVKLIMGFVGSFVGLSVRLLSSAQLYSPHNLNLPTRNQNHPTVIYPTCIILPYSTLHLIPLQQNYQSPFLNPFNSQPRYVARVT